MDNTSIEQILKSILPYLNEGKIMSEDGKSFIRKTTKRSPEYLGIIHSLDFFDEISDKWKEYTMYVEE